MVAWNGEVMAENFTAIPNYFFDHMHNMDKCEQMVFMLVARKTAGYQKEWDEISFSQFVNSTGLGKASVNAGIQSALNRGIIQRRQNGNSFEYCLSEPKNGSEIEPVQKLNSSEIEPICTDNGSKIEPFDIEIGSEIEPIVEKTVQKLNTQYKYINTINTLSTNVDVQSTQTSLSSDGKKTKPDKPKKVSQPATDADADAEPTQTPEQQEWFGALCWLIYGHKEYKLLSKIDKIAIGRTAKEIRGLEYTIDDLRTWYKTIWCKEFPGLQKSGAIQNPRLKDIKTGIGKVKPTSHTNGFNAPVAQASVPTYKRIEQL